jgi:predicted RNA binding protein YcfA (HicA-like mRNA interferase family)
MPKPYSSRQVEKLLTKQGFVFVSQKGSHQKFTKHIKKDNKTLIVIVPANWSEIPHGTLRSILRQADLKLEDF